MNPYAIPAFIAAAANILLGAYILHKNPKKAENIVFALLTAACVIWTVSEGLIISAADESASLFWSRVEWTGVSFLNSIFLHFILLFPSRRKILDNRLIYPVLYIPGFIFLYLAWATDLLVKGTQTTYWAKYYPVYGSAFDAYSAYFMAASLIGFSLFWKAYKTSDREIIRTQAKYMLAGTLIPTIGGSVTNVILPARGIYLFPTAGILTLVMAAIIAYAMTRHQLMSIMPIALENVVNGITQGVVISDAFGRIIKINSSAEQITGLKPDDTGQKFGAVMQSVLQRVENAKEFEQLVEKANASPDEIATAKVVLNAPAKRFLDVSVSPVKDEKGGAIGQVAMFYDVTERKKSEEEMKKLNQELQSKVAELKRFNDIAVGRELKMIELKKRIAEFEQQSRKSK